MKQINKFKAKTVAVLVAGGILLGGFTGYATASDYYADLLHSQKDSIKEEVMTLYDEIYQERNQQVHADLVVYVEERKQEILQHFEQVIREKVNTEAEARQHQHADEIDKVFNQLVEEINSELVAK